jgi:hypothetical protein
MKKIIALFSMIVMASGCASDNNLSGPQKSEAASDSTVSESISTQTNAINKGIADRAAIIPK